ncbi:MAG: Holliday junction resolvase RuvX [Alphaproteobacteria bacterium]|nr:Holliday junction resolvase RuvX [Alphaproteobacteria bacterium]
MPVGLLKDIAAARPANVPLLGLDVGEKTIGVAISDSGQSIAMPLCTIKRTKFSRDILDLQAILREREIGGIVIGLPLNMDGSEGRRCQSVRDFAAELVRSGIAGPDAWIALADERFSTESVEDLVEKHGMKRRKAKDSGLTDRLAAQRILQGALDGLQMIG